MTVIFKRDLLPDFEMPDETSPEGVRYYVTPNGDRYRSVTTILGAAEDKSWLIAWRKKIGEEEARKISERAKHRGAIIHKGFERLLMNEADPARGINMMYKPHYLAGKKILEDNVTCVRGIEYPLWSDILKTAGRTDLFADWNDTPSIVDFKGSNQPKTEDQIQGYFLQTATYSFMMEERTRIHVPQIVIVILVDHDKPQVFIKPSKLFIPEVKRIFCGSSLENFFTAP